MPKEPHTSGDAHETLKSLAKHLGVQKNTAALVAAIVSLKESGAIDLSNRIYDRAGGYRVHLPHVDPHRILSSWVAAQYSIDASSDECADLICAHISEGAKKIRQMITDTGDVVSVMADIERRFSSYVPDLPKFEGGFGQSINIAVGNLEGQPDRPFFWPISDANANPHTAILGQTRSGKTQLLLDILAQIREQSGGQSNFIFLCYRKDDGVSRFAQDLGIEMYDPNQAPLPINPFILRDYSDREINKSAQEKCDLVAEFDHSIRGKQKGFLRNAIVEAYSARRGEEVPYPDFNEVRDLVLQTYGDETNTLTEMLDAFVNLNLFQRALPGTSAQRFLSETTCVVKLEDVPDRHRAIVASLILESFARETSSLPLARIDPESGTRAIRACIVIDEAHNYLRGQNYFLDNLLRQSADKGFIVLLATQTPSSLCAKQDFRELIGNFFLFHCHVNPQEAQFLTNCRAAVRQQIADEIQNLKPGYCFANRSPNPQAPYCRIEAAQYYRRTKAS
jgi:hypothetical protein